MSTSTTVSRNSSSSSSYSTLALSIRPITTSLYFHPRPQARVAAEEEDLMPPETFAKKGGDLRRWKNQQRIIMKMEAMMLFMQDSSSRFPARTRKRGFKVYENAFSGEDIIKWQCKHGGFLSRQEAMRYNERLFEMGYIVSSQPFSVDQFVANKNALYTLQRQEFWPSMQWAPSDIDYTIFLCKRVQLGGKYALENIEFIRFKDLKMQYGYCCDMIANIATEQLLLPTWKDDMIMEWGMWKVYRPLSVPRSILFVEEFVNDKPFYMCPCQQGSRDTFFRVMSDFANYDNEEEREDDEDESESDTQSIPSHHDISLWRQSFHDLIHSPVGLALFRNHLRNEVSLENIDFYLACTKKLKVAKSHSSEQFQGTAYDIFNEFLSDTARRPINIDANTRQRIVEQIYGSEQLSYDIYHDAVQDIYGLMRDSYNRFLNSEKVKALAKSPWENRLEGCRLCKYVLRSFSELWNGVFRFKSK